MIVTQFNAVETLMASCPAFHSVAEAFTANCAKYPGEPPLLYMLMGDLVVECSKQLATGNDAGNDTGSEAGIASLFDLVERWIVEGDKYVVEMAVAGFIEDMQNEGLHKDTKPEDFERFLGPKSTEYWHKVSRFWSHGEPISKG